MVTQLHSVLDGTGNIPLTTTLANSGVTAGTYGSGTEIPSLVVDAKGRITPSVVAVSSDLPSAGDLALIQLVCLQIPYTSRWHRAYKYSLQTIL